MCLRLYSALIINDGYAITFRDSVIQSLHECIPESNARLLVGQLWHSLTAITSNSCFTCSSVDFVDDDAVWAPRAHHRPHLSCREDPGPQGCRGTIIARVDFERSVAAVNCCDMRERRLPKTYSASTRQLYWSLLCLPVSRSTRS